MSDRPVSLAAVEDMLRKCGYHDIVPLLASVPTFAPATPDAATIARAAYVLGYKSGHADTVESRFTFDPGERWDEDEQLRADVGIATPTKPPREMPAPKVGMVAVYDDTGEVLIKSTSNGAPFTDPRHIVRIYWPGPTPVVIWERA